MLLNTIKSNSIDGLQWLCCPKCGAKTNIGVYFNTALESFPLYCPKCKTETLISGINYKMMYNIDVHSAYMQTRKSVKETSQEPKFTKTD